VKGHAGDRLNEAADERANAAAKAYQAKQEPRRGPGFTLAAGDGAAVAASAPIAASANAPARTQTPAPASAPVATAPSDAPLWAETSSLFDDFDTPSADPIELRISLTGDEHARLRDRAEAQGISLEAALRRLI
jgi:ribonuclease HI